ncbi:hypothetical protein CRM22_001041 [Opisthorchis felineus]|uniref:CSC1/OSCA1-like 7TM region domain-containing protein n=1 Tax=Opisthorchis felineus TaxID=147828 RepID=A0A4S2MCD3_OPIFE|nr:hypothetical protein CRM22_001041 [Opisthorchis felineus]
MPYTELARNAGLDGVAYLRSTVYSALQLATMAPFLFVAVPIYYRGGKADTDFARLTISNLGMQDSDGAWVLLAMTICCILLYLGSTFLRLLDAYTWPINLARRSHTPRLSHSTGELRHCKDEASLSFQLINVIPNVLMLHDVIEKPESELREELQTYLSALDPNATIKWLHYVRDLSDLAKLEIRRRELECFSRLSGEELKQTGIPPTYQRSCCDPTCCHPSLALPLDAIETYSAQLEEVGEQQKQIRASMGLDGDCCENECKATFTGLVFVGLDSPVSSLGIAKELFSLAKITIPLSYTVHPETHKHGVVWSSFESPLPQAVRKLRRPFRELLLAPPAEELIWTNLMQRRHRGLFWQAVVCLRAFGIFTLALFLSSPSYLLVALNYISQLKVLTPEFNILIYQWVPALILVGSAALVKLLVVYSENWNNHGTYSGQEKVGQRRLYAFLVVNILLLPSLGVSGVPAILLKIFNSSLPEGAKLRIECIFLPDSSVLFINYIITCSLLGSGLTLMQLGRIFLFLVRRWSCCIHSAAEAECLARENAGPFPFRERYASMMLIQTIAVAYAPISPIVIPFGMLYFLCDYFTCKYALVQIYHPDWREDGRGTRLETPDRGAPDNKLYRLTWSIQATLNGLTGICLAVFNLFVFFVLRVRIEQMQRPLLAYLMLCVLTPLICVVLSVIVAHRLVRLSYWCERYSRPHELDSYPGPDHPSHSNTQRAYTNPLLRPKI